LRGRLTGRCVCLCVCACGSYGEEVQKIVAFEGVFVRCVCVFI
jgi:hypothetical protein